MRAIRRTLIVAGGVLVLSALAGAAAVWLLQFRPPQASLSFEAGPWKPAPDDLSWTATGGDPGAAKFSRISQITPRNVGRLDVAWTYDTGETARRGALIRRSKFQATPILAAGSLVLCTPFNRVVALDPRTGKERWIFDPNINLGQRPSNDFNCRGLAQWMSSDATEELACSHRLFTATNDRRLIALDARTGRRCTGFGRDGEVKVIADEGLEWPGEVQIVAPPLVVGNVVIVGSSVADSRRAAAANGSVHAYDARTGRLVWTFDPTPDSRGRTGGGNVWSSMSADPERDLVFLPTSSPSPDFFGGGRTGRADLANSVVAVRASTGAVVWSFQTVHHDLWDYDLPSAPALFNLRRGGREVPALAIAAKSGFLFVLNREDGKPLYPVIETPTPRSDVPGETSSPTQPFSTLPALARQSTRPDEAFGVAVFDKAACRKALSRARNEGLFTPPSLKGTVLTPSTGGGANWGGIALDPNSNRMVVNVSNAAELITLIEHDKPGGRVTPMPEGAGPQTGTPYSVTRGVMLSPLGLPCSPPPWGELVALDLDNGDIAWRAPLGTTSTLAPFGIALRWGTPNLGGPLVTGSGLVFIGAAMDNRVRAYELSSGRELWAADLPAGGQASPMTYAVGGRQYVVIAAGGHSVLDTTRGAEVVAFALPER